MWVTYRNVSKPDPHELNVYVPANPVVKLKKCSGASCPTLDVPPVVLPVTAVPQVSGSLPNKQTNKQTNIWRHCFLVSVGFNMAKESPKLWCVLASQVHRRASAQRLAH
jgi:hypothetical protein